MADPLTVDIKLPLAGGGWVQVRAHIADLGSSTVEGRRFVRDLVDRVRDLAAEMCEAGLIIKPAGQEEEPDAQP